MGAGRDVKGGPAQRRSDLSHTQGGRRLEEHERFFRDRCYCDRTYTAYKGRIRTGLATRAIARAYRRVVAMGSLDTGFRKSPAGAIGRRHVHDRSTGPHMVPGRGFGRGIGSPHVFRA